MPQLDFVIYLYQFLLLAVTFFILYDIMLNYLLPGLLNCVYITKRKSNQQQTSLCHLYANKEC